MTRARHLSLVRPDGSSFEPGRERDALVREVATVLASTSSFRGALPRALEALCRELDAVAAHAWVRRDSADAEASDADGRTRSGDGLSPAGWRHLWHPDPPPPGFDGLRRVLFETEPTPDAGERRSGGGPTVVEPGRSPVAGDALGSRDVARVDDVSRVPSGEWAASLADAEVRGVVALPVFAGRRPAAVLELFFAATLTESGLPGRETLAIVRSELERRADYERMRSAVQRSARLWRSLTAGSSADAAAERVGSRERGGPSVRLTPAGRGREGLYDTATGLPSRALLLDRVDHTLARRTRQPDRRFALVVFEIEGRPGSGDRVDDDAAASGGRSAPSLPEIVAAVGRRLRDNVRPGDSVGRLSESRLAVLLEDVSDRSEAAAVARRLNDAVGEEEFDLLADGGARIRVGLALARPAHESAEDVADEAVADAAREELG